MTSRLKPFALAIVGCALGASAQQSGTLQVTVEDEAGAFVPGASVMVAHFSQPSDARVSLPPTLHIDGQYKTDGKGQVLLHLLPARYQVFAIGDIFAPVAKDQKVESGKTTTWTVVLPLSRFTKAIE